MARAKKPPDATGSAGKPRRWRGAIAEVVEGVAARRRRRRPTAPAPDEVAAARTPPPRLRRSTQLAKLLKAGDADAETESERLARCLARTAAAARASAVAASAGRYDFDGAADALAELRAEIVELGLT